ncbi:unnamed protein product [Moneuplotes crassus]|uniref:Uncharacterized protein n=1 Tax=Euplotes crassus TaxID=5936 RepID=A0AAD1UIQ6_EUPCR|nr:unnamed protein product [Moneuplotes crassus]
MNDKNFDLDNYLKNHLEYDEDDKDHKLEASKLENEIEHYRELMSMQGFSKVGNILPGCTLDDTRATLKALKEVCAKRKEDIEFKGSIRSTINDLNHKIQTMHEENERLLSRNEALTSRNKQLTNQLQQANDNRKQESREYGDQVESLRKANLKLSHQVTQQQHDIKKIEQQNNKLKDRIKQKIFDKDMNVKNTIDMTKPIYMNGPLVYVNKSGENEFTYLVTKANQEVQSSLKTENEDLRDCIKMLQDELLEIIKVKTENYQKRFNTEFKQNLEEEFARHDIEPVNKDLVNMPYEESGKKIILQFQENIRKLRDFLGTMDRDMAARFAEEDNYDEDDTTLGREFANIRSVSQLKHLLANYKDLVEAQEVVIQGDVALRSGHPLPDEIVTPESRFRIISDREIERMRERLEKQKVLLDKEQNEIDVKKSIIEQKSTIY